MLLHVTDNDGHGVAIPLDRQSLSELGAQVAVALERLREPGGRASFIWNVVRAVAAETMNPTNKGPESGIPDADGSGKKDR